VHEDRRAVMDLSIEHPNFGMALFIILVVAKDIR
jgi:hypothetical protein